MHSGPKTKSLLTFICLALIALNILVTVAFLPKGGWDADVYCNAVSVSQLGLNPYDRLMMQEQTGSVYPLPYPPIILPIFSTLCGIGTSYYSFLFLSIATFALTFSVLKRKGSELYLATLLIAGFHAFSRATISGNIVPIEMLLLSLALRDLFLNKQLRSGLLFGCLAFIKLQPIIFVIVALLFQIRKAAFKLISGVALSLLSLYGLCAAFWPKMFRNYLEFVWDFVRENATNTGKSTVSEGAELYNSSSLELLVDFSNILLKLPESLGKFSYVVLVIAFVASAALVRFRNNYDNKTVLFFLLLVPLVLPRFKDYSYALLLPITFLVSADFSIRAKISILLSTCALPIISFFLSPRAGVVDGSVGDRLWVMWQLHYLQLSFLLGIILIGVTLNAMKQHTLEEVQGRSHET